MTALLQKQQEPTKKKPSQPKMKWMGSRKRKQNKINM
jgi:hypothetical protein